MEVSRGKDGWDITPPSHRFDIAIEADLIEEVARIIGFDAIPETDAAGLQRFSPLPEELPAEQSVLDVLATRGYQETITFAFVDPSFQAQLFPERETLTLSNPIASDLSAMRVSLWPGLLRAALENQRRQQDRVRVFEHGSAFDVKSGHVTEVESIAALALGPRLPEQWSAKREPTDFFDVKADLEALLVATGDIGSISFVPRELSCLHPGRSARIVRGGKEVGWIGELHPALVRELQFNSAPILFELNFADALGVRTARYAEVSRFPQVRRDIAVVVDESVSLSALRERVTLTGSSLLRDLRVFDVYRGSGVENGRKSVALGLIFQDISRTLTDEDVDQAIASIVGDLRASLDARIRE
jgi:phenylalanyl-tRNA synthetase beta chain